MAQDTVDAVCRKLGVERACTTDTEPLPGSESGENYRLDTRLARKEAALVSEQMICECELVPLAKLKDALNDTASTVLDDIRRRLRLAMGPCQGGFCIYRAAGVMHELDHLDASQANASLRDFLQERWKDLWPVLYGDQLR
jgi:glycerol-3-phosphate dehydrogenase